MVASEIEKVIEKGFIGIRRDTWRDVVVVVREPSMHRGQILAEHHQQQGLLCMKAVFRLIEHH